MGQERHSKGKLYSLHAPEVECICKNKVHRKHKFGVKVSVATDIKSNLVVGMMPCQGNPYDGHMKADGRLGRNTLAGRIGVALLARLCGSCHNIRLLLSQIASFCALASGGCF